MRTFRVTRNRRAVAALLALGFAVAGFVSADGASAKSYKKINDPVVYSVSCSKPLAKRTNVENIACMAYAAAPEGRYPRYSPKTVDRGKFDRSAR